MSSVDIEFSFRKSLFRSKRVKRKIISVPVIAPIKKKKSSPWQCREKPQEMMPKYHLFSIVSIATNTEISSFAFMR